MKAKKPTLPDELIQEISRENCVAYIGSGLSAGAGLPLWKRLLELMVEWCKSRGIKLPSQKELKKLFRENKFLLLADILTKRMGEGEYHDFLVSIFRREGLTPTENHNLLPEIPFVSILTSNYDKLIESAYTTFNNGVSPHVFTQLDRSEMARALRSKEFHILKTHGDIDRLESLVLTFSDYRSLMYANEAYKLYLQNIFTSKTILFLGFSLTDPDLMGLLDGVREIFGDDTPRHYALMDVTNLSTSEQEHFRDNYGIRIIGYRPSAPSHPEVTEFLKELIRRTPKKFYRNLEQAKQELENLDTHYKVVGTTENEFFIEEKFPGAAKEKPLQYRVTLVFDTETEEGRAAKDAWDNFVKTGETTTLSSPHLQNIKMPDFLSKLIDFVPESITMTVGTYQSGKKFRYRFIATAEDGTRAAIDNIELEKISHGEEFVTLDNYKQNYFFQVRFVWELKTKIADVSFKYDSEGKTIYQALTIERFLSILAKGGTLSIENTESGMPLGSAVFPAGEITSSEPLYIQVLEALLLIQQKLGASFQVPERLLLAEAKNILDAAQIIRTGKVEGTLKANIEVEREIAERMAEGIGSFGVQQTAESIYVIQGQKISLGGVWTVAEKLILSDEEKSRLLKELDENPDQKEFVIEVTNSPDLPTVIYYLNFLPDEEFEQLNQEPQFRAFTLDNLLTLLFDAATDEDGIIHFSTLISILIEAAKQVTDSGKPFNMLKRATADELAEALKPLLPRLSAKKAENFIAELVGLGIVAENESSKILNLEDD